MVQVPKRTTLTLVLAAAGMVWILIRWGNSAVAPQALFEGQSAELPDCPDRPNCVCSSASRPGQQVAAIALSEAPATAVARLAAIVTQISGSRLVLSQDDYLHAEFRSRVFGFVDDLELLVEEDRARISVRSASRVGYSDLGTNRKRVERIRQLYQADLAAELAANLAADADL